VLPVRLFATGPGVLIPMLAYRVSLDAGPAQGAERSKQTAAAAFGQGLGSAAASWSYGVAVEALSGGRRCYWWAGRWPAWRLSGVFWLWLSEPGGTRR